VVISRIALERDVGDTGSGCSEQIGRHLGSEAHAEAPPECVGPIDIPARLMRKLCILADAAGVDYLVALQVCAAALASRLNPNEDACARVIQGRHEAVVGLPPGNPDPGPTFRAALRQGGTLSPVETLDTPAGRRTDVTFLVSQDGRRLFAESMSTSTDAPTAQCWARSFMHLLECMTRQPDVPVTAHPLMDANERGRILRGLNPYRRPVAAYRTMVEPFEEQARRSPNACALVDEDGEAVSYSELNRRANRLAHFLRAAGTAPGARIAICMERSIRQIVAIYAVVKTGAAYVPLDADLPDERLAYMLRDTAPLHVLTDTACRERIPTGDWRVHDTELDHESWAACSAANVTPEGTAAKILHILYTSGSTGRPKGVAYPTDGALAHLEWLQSQYPFGVGDSALFKTSPGFDVSIWEIFWPLWHGARVVVCRPGAQRDPRDLARLVADHGICTIFLPPTVMMPFLQHVSSVRAGALRWAFCGGEPVTARVRDTFHATLGSTALINCYGPTEAGGVTDMVLARWRGGSIVPLGRPAPHFRLVLLDQDLQPVPVGMAGEAYIGGEIGLAHAYWRAPARTAERFVPDPHGAPAARMYRTGDLCRYRDDGVLEHLGRIDRQIKVLGMRIEPGEIESVLMAHPSVADCAVLPYGDPVRLIAFVVPAAPLSVTDLDAGALLAHAATTIPAHMQPHHVVPVADIPATVNGKIDRGALMAAWEALIGIEREIVPPADDLEACLVEMYSRILGISPVSITDNFTQLGGHSMLAAQLLEECAQGLHAKPDATVVVTGTIREVADSVRTRLAYGYDNVGD
jgi:amino acid adenylation domain-containing protein